VDGARDRFVPVPVSPRTSTVASVGRDGRHVPKGFSERTALADDFLEGMLGADLALAT
jgi:hypothetical protein